MRLAYSFYSLLFWGTLLRDKVYGFILSYKSVVSFTLSRRQGGSLTDSTASTAYSKAVRGWSYEMPEESPSSNEVWYFLLSLHPAWISGLNFFRCQGVGASGAAQVGAGQEMGTHCIVEMGRISPQFMKLKCRFTTLPNHLAGFILNKSVIYTQAMCLSTIFFCLLSFDIVFEVSFQLKLITESFYVYLSGKCHTTDRVKRKVCRVFRLPLLVLLLCYH